jgi:hypothetical protein
MLQLVAVTRDLLNFDYPRDCDDQVHAAHRNLRLRVIEAMCECERIMPSTELSVLFHILIHLPDMIERWNNVRNFWCFFGERCMGFYIRFIKNRDLAIENIVSAYSRATLVIGAPPGIVQSAYLRQRALGMSNQNQSLLQVANEVQVSHQYLPHYAHIIYVHRFRYVHLYLYLFVHVHTYRRT